MLSLYRRSRQQQQQQGKHCQVGAGLEEMKAGNSDTEKKTASSAGDAISRKNTAGMGVAVVSRMASGNLSENGDRVKDHVGTFGRFRARQRRNRNHAEHHRKWITAIAGATSGALGAVFVAPLDVVKARLQVQRQVPGVKPRYRGTFSSLATIAKEEGLHGMFRGLPPTMLGYVPSWSIYFTCYGWFKDLFLEAFGSENYMKSTVMAAVSGGAVSNLATNPFWVVRTRLQVQEHVLREPEYKSTRHAFQQIVRQEGFLALYKGLTASMLGLSHVAVQFPLYEWLKEISREDNEESNSLLSIIVASSISKVIATVLTYPHDVARSRLHVYKASVGEFRTLSERTGSGPSWLDRPGSQNSSPGVFRVIFDMVRKEGVHSLYQGLGTQVVRVTPACAITFTSYEVCVSLLERGFSIRTPTTSVSQ